MLVLVVRPSAVPAPEGGGERERDVPEKETEEKKEVTGHMKQSPKASRAPQCPGRPTAARAGVGAPGEQGSSASPSPSKGFRSAQTSAATFVHAGKDIREKERVSPAYSMPKVPQGGGQLIQISAHQAKYPSASRTLRLCPWALTGSAALVPLSILRRPYLPRGAAGVMAQEALCERSGFDYPVRPAAYRPLRTGRACSSELQARVPPFPRAPVGAHSRLSGKHL